MNYFIYILSLLLPRKETCTKCGKTEHLSDIQYYLKEDLWITTHFIKQMNINSASNVLCWHITNKGCQKKLSWQRNKANITLSLNHSASGILKFLLCEQNIEDTVHEKSTSIFIRMYQALETAQRLKQPTTKRCSLKGMGMCFFKKNINLQYFLCLKVKLLK